jgi:hypothetical protein
MEIMEIERKRKHVNTLEKYHISLVEADYT